MRGSDAVKSKAATLMAEVVRQEGASLWTRLVPDLMAMAASEEPQAAEMGANVIRFVAEDVAVYNEDLIGGRMQSCWEVCRARWERSYRRFIRSWRGITPRRNR